MSAGGLYRPCVVCGVRVDARAWVARCARHRRPPTRFYGSSAWQRQRAAFLATHPWCVFCLAEGRGRVRARVVDHIVPRKHGGLDTPANYRALCVPCHDRRTAIEQSGWARKSR
jgi:5-methylcytosine-specific restriction enzyme A